MIFSLFFVYFESNIDFCCFFQYTLHYDCCNGISLHPTKPIIASSSGQHHFSVDEIMNGEENSDGNDNETVKASENGQTAEQKIKENSLILWWCGKTATTSNEIL